MASDSEEIEYQALESSNIRLNTFPSKRDRNEDNEDDSSDISLHEEQAFLVHMSPDANKSQWNHVDDLDKFFVSVYDYHQRHGFQNMVLAETLQLLQFAFIVLFVTYLNWCVNYKELFDEVPHNTTHKKTFSDITYPLPECTAKISFFSWLLLFLCSLFFVGRCIKMAINFCNYIRTRNFFISALNVETKDLSNMTWHEVQLRLLEVQKEQQICIHKQELTQLDIYHRILRFKNYLVAMVNKELLPLRFKLPLVGEHAVLTHGMRFNLEILLYWSPWSIFLNSYTMREEYKSAHKRKQLKEQLSMHIALLALLNLVFSPFIFFYQIIYFFFRYAEFVKRSPSFLGSRQWANYGRLYLRHFNELDHELTARLNRAYIPADMYMKSFTSASLIILAKYIAFFAGAPAAVLFILGILDFSDVTKVEHLFTVATVCGMITTVCTGLIPDENEVFCPERLMMSILAQIHYMPDSWKGKAHTSHVRDEFSMLFQYKVVYILEELLSPFFTPFWLLFALRPKSAQVVDFFRCFTLEVAGVGDVCSFAQMDIKKHGNPEWCVADPKVSEKAPQTSRAQHGKTELSLMHFTTTNPEWKPPQESNKFVTEIIHDAQKEMPALTSMIADPISLPSLGYVNPVALPYTMGSSLQRSAFGQDIYAGSMKLRGGLSNLDGPINQAGNLSTSFSNTGSFYSANYNMSMVDEGQRELLTGNMSLSVLHLHDKHHRLRSGGGPHSGDYVYGHTSSYKRQHSAGERTDYRQYQEATNSPSSLPAHRGHFSGLEGPYDRSGVIAGDTSGGAAGGGYGFHLASGLSATTSDILMTSTPSTGSVIHREHGDECSETSRLRKTLDDATASNAMCSSVSEDPSAFNQYGSTLGVSSGPTSLPYMPHPLARGFLAKDDDDDLSSSDLPPLGMPNISFNNANIASSRGVQGAAHMPQIKEDLGDEHEMDTSGQH